MMCLLLGATGVGKTLLVKRLQTILPRGVMGPGAGCARGTRDRGGDWGAGGTMVGGWGWGGLRAPGPGGQGWGLGAPGARSGRRPPPLLLSGSLTARHS